MTSDSPDFDTRAFRLALTPNIPLNPNDPLHRKYYVDLSATRQPGGASACDRLCRKIAELSPDTPTVNLFTGRMGSGKSTELLRLKRRLEQPEEGQPKFAVVYHLVPDDIELSRDTALEVGEIILSIARAVAKQLEGEGCTFEARKTRGVLQNILDVLNTDVSIGSMKLSAGLGEVTFNFKSKSDGNPDERQKLRIALARDIPRLGELINEELIKPAAKYLRQSGRRGLVIIADGLDRIYPDARSGDTLTVPEHIFIAKAYNLNQFDCHIIYTMPHTLVFSERHAEMRRTLGVDRPEILPMVAVHCRDSNAPCEDGIRVLGDVVLARAFPHTPARERRARIRELFFDPAELDALCRLSSGNARELFAMLIYCLAEVDPPFKTAVVDGAIRNAKDAFRGLVSVETQPLLAEIHRIKQIRGFKQASALNFRSFVYEYEDEQGRWFDVNPLIELPPAEG